MWIDDNVLSWNEDIYLFLLENIHQILSSLCTLKKWVIQKNRNLLLSVFNSVTIPVFFLLQEAFSTAKLEFRSFKMKTRANLAKTHYGPDTLEEAVQDYINRNIDLYDLPGMVAVSATGFKKYN